MVLAPLNNEVCDERHDPNATGDRIGAIRDAALAAALDNHYGKPWMRQADVYRELRAP